jgi:hypothetical protein
MGRYHILYKDFNRMRRRAGEMTDKQQGHATQNTTTKTSDKGDNKGKTK